jgi:hypothetical protein
MRDASSLRVRHRFTSTNELNTSACREQARLTRVHGRSHDHNGWPYQVRHLWPTPSSAHRLRVAESCRGQPIWYRGDHTNQGDGSEQRLRSE